VDPILNQLIQGGAMGLFAAFLVWQHVGMQKRLDALVERFQDQLNKINENYDERIERMRERYDGVIQSVRDEAASAAKDWSNTRAQVQEQVVNRIDLLGAKVDQALDEIRRD
jgi:F0F1-type ATP synthase membrane subunit b/b'